MPFFNKRKIGFLQEDRAVSYLERNGYKIIGRNFYSKFGEIDIIASKDSYLHFIEVRSRSSERYGLSLESVNNKKIKKIINTAYYFLKKNKIKTDKISISIISIDNSGNNIKLKLIKYD
jgi:putative endonuclease